MASASRSIRSFSAVTGTATFLAALGLSACQSNMAGDDAGVAADADFITCVGETRAPPFEQGMQVMSQDGTLVLKVLKNTYKDATGKVLTVKPTKGNDEWTIETDAAATSTPVDGLTMNVTPFMPDHGHGTSVIATVTSQGSGTYLVAPLNLYMAGYWEITFDITDASMTPPVADTAVVKICVPD